MKKGPLSFPESKKYSRRVKEDDSINARMQEWFTVLSADYTPLTPLNISIRYFAVLGATGRVLEALKRSEDRIGEKILPFELLKGLRNTIYFALNPFAELNRNNRKFLTFFSHLYEHCRNEIGKITGTAQFPALLQPIDLTERDKPYFTQAMAYAVKAGAVHRQRVLAQAKETLNGYDELLQQLSKHFEDNPGCLVVEENAAAYRRSDTIRGSAIGAVLGRFSIELCALLKGDFYETHDKKRKSSLSVESKAHILQEFRDCITAGKLYRYEQLSLDAVVQRFGIVAIPAQVLQLNMEREIELADIQKCHNLLPKWASHPFVGSEAEKDVQLGKWLISCASNGQLPLVKLLAPRCLHNSWRAFSLVHAARQGHEAVVNWLLHNIPCSDDLLKYAIEAAQENHQSGTARLLNRKLTGELDLDL